MRMRQALYMRKRPQDAKAIHVMSSGLKAGCHMVPRRDPAGLSLPWPGRSHVHSAVHSNTGV